MERDELFAIANNLLNRSEKDEQTCLNLKDVYPILTKSKYKRNRRREITVGLLGLQPSRIDETTSSESGYESVYTRRDDE